MSARIFIQHASLFTVLTKFYVRNLCCTAKWAERYTRSALQTRRRGSICRVRKLLAIPPTRACTTTAADQDSPAVTFDDERVQELLKRMTGRDFDKIFAVRVEDLEIPKYQLMTDEELKEARRETDELADNLLKMPLQLPEREEQGQVISKDDKLEGYDDHRYAFTDISVGTDNKTRQIVVRETDGTLRHARWSERDRLNQTYFPMAGRKITFPAMLMDENLSQVFDQLRHADVLDLVCVQCPPDSTNYIRVHRRSHADLLWRENFDLLYSTRHYGPFLWFLAGRHQLEGVLKYFLTTNKEESAIDMVSLYHTMYPKSSSAIKYAETNVSGLPALKLFCKSMNYDNILQLLEQSSKDDQENSDNVTNSTTSI